MIRFAALGSGSRGNALVVEAGETRLLLDCGFGPRELTRRLARLNLRPEDLDAILVTHEHSDHIGGVAACSRRFGVPVAMTCGTYSAGVCGELENITLIDSHMAFSVGDIEISPFPVPHDAREPVQFVFSDGSARLGVLTDTGVETPHIVASLMDCDGLVLECNHDRGLLESGPYPPRLKQRVGGRFGHLDNASAAALLGRVAGNRLKHLVAAHISEHNNNPDLVRATLARVLDWEPESIGIADQALGFDWRQI